MTLWMILTLMVAVAVAGLTVPLVRRYDIKSARDSNIAVLKRQLREIDAQQASGTLGPDEAEGMRVEIKRRILAEGRVDETPPRPFDARALPWAAVALAGIVALAATGLYALVGHPGIGTARPVDASPIQQTDAQSGSAQHPIADIATMIGQLEAKMRETPNNPEGWRMLGWSYLSVGRAGDAATAYGRAAALDPGNAEYPSARGEALVQAARGQVTPEALTAFRAALKIDPSEPRARYFMAVNEDQQGQHDKAMSDWIALVKSAPPGAPWAGEVRSFIQRMAAERHIDLTGKLPAMAPAAPAAAAMPQGPTQDQVAAARQMSRGDREAMIHSMVDKLAGELKANPHNAAGWERLLRARMVLGQNDEAASAYRDAQRALADTPGDLAALRGAAKALGVPGE